MAFKTAFWDPETLLEIRDPGDTYARCAGQNRTLAGRCGWRFFGYAGVAVFQRVAILAQTPLAEVNDNDLRTLAQLCLCRDNHADQAAAVVARWRDIVAAAARDVPTQSRPPKPSPFEKERQRSMIELGFDGDCEIKLYKLIRQELATLRTKITVKTDELTQANQALQDARNNIETLQQAQWRSEEEERNLRDQLEGATWAREEAERAHLTQLADKQALIQRSITELDEVRTSLKARESLDAKVQETVALGKEYMDKVRIELQDAESTRAELVGQIEERDKELSGARSILKAMQQENNKIHDDNNRLASQIASVQRDLHNTEQQKAELHDDNDRLISQIAIVQQSLHNAEQQKAELYDDNDRLTSRIAGLQQSLHDAEQQKAKLHDDNNHLANQITSVQQSLYDAEQQKAKLHDDNDRLTSQIAGVQRNLHDSEQQKSKLGSDIAEMTKLLEQSSLKGERIAEEKSRVKAEVNDLRDQVARLEKDAMMQKSVSRWRVLAYGAKRENKQRGAGYGCGLPSLHLWRR